MDRSQGKNPCGVSNVIDMCTADDQEPYSMLSRYFVYAGIPIVSALIGWTTNYLAVKMILQRLQVKRVKGLPNFKKFLTGNSTFPVMLRPESDRAKSTGITT